MKALKLFRTYKKDVTDAWTEAVFATYPLETTGFLRTRRDPFSNPVAHMTREAADILFDAMIGEDVSPAQVKAALERFVKLRAVQKFAPSQNMAVFYLMKPILREKVLPELRLKGQLDAYLAAESRLDSLALLAFDIYTRARETVAEARIREIRNQHAQLARWAQRLEDGPPPLGETGSGEDAATAQSAPSAPNAAAAQDADHAPPTAAAVTPSGVTTTDAGASSPDQTGPSRTTGREAPAMNPSQAR